MSLPQGLGQRAGIAMNAAGSNKICERGRKGNTNLA